MKMIVPKKKPSLPAQIDQFMDCVVDGYNSVINSNAILNPQRFIKITNATKHITFRAQQEKKYYETQNVKPPEGSYDSFVPKKRK